MAELGQSAIGAMTSKTDRVEGLLVVDHDYESGQVLDLDDTVQVLEGLAVTGPRR